MSACVCQSFKEKSCCYIEVLKLLSLNCNCTYIYFRKSTKITNGMTKMIEKENGKDGQIVVVSILDRGPQIY